MATDASRTIGRVEETVAGDVRAVPVWDLPTRIFHWTLALAVFTAYASGEGEGALFIVHTLAGYLVALLLTFRLIWGAIGSMHSRFADFVYAPRSVAAYARRLARLHPPRFVGHNPLGGWMVIAMLAVLAAAVATGLVSGGDEGGRGLLLPLVASPGGEGLGDLHEFFGELILLLATFHVLGVFVDWLLLRDNLIAAMIDGRKRLDVAEAARQPPLVAAWRAWVAVAFVLALGALLVQQTDFGAVAQSGEHAEYEHEDD
jgi:cytochrome b